MVKTINIIVAILFVLFAIVQWNDPDPLKWIILYGSVAIVSALAAINRYYRYFTLALLLACTIGLILLIPEVITWINNGMPTIAGSMQAESPHIELMREFFGLVLCGLALGWNLRSMKKFS
ncbi:MAG: transmembrane 220 family protein [Bacteroidota bacterium]